MSAKFILTKQQTDTGDALCLVNVDHVRYFTIDQYCEEDRGYSVIAILDDPDSTIMCIEEFQTFKTAEHYLKVLCERIS